MSNISIETKKITELEAAALNELSESDLFVIRLNSGSTKKLTSALLRQYLTGATEGDIFSGEGAGFHNAIYRGKNLGDTVTAAQRAAIQAGTFDDMYIGDYWEINSVKYRIAAFDYWYRCGDTECTTHHVVLVPDTNLATAKMNETNITTGGYVGSDMYTGANSNTGLSTAKSAINSAFGSQNILSHKEYFTNAVTNGYPSAGAWYNSTVDLMNERMVYGGPVFTPAVYGGSGNTVIPANYTIDKSQLPLFGFRPDLICNRANWWLRDVVSSAYFANVTNSGNATSNSASIALGVRPAFAIC